MNIAAAVPGSNTQTLQTVAASTSAGATKAMTFREVLSELNPLQYLPVIGTIYRAVTGDVIPKPVRETGSVLVSGLLGGPVGVAASLATLAFQKLTGIDFEDVEQGLISALHAGPSQPAPPAIAASIPQAEAPAHTGAWTPMQLAAYGVVTSSDGVLPQQFSFWPCR